MQQFFSDMEIKIWEEKAKGERKLTVIKSPHYLQSGKLCFADTFHFVCVTAHSGRLSIINADIKFIIVFISDEMISKMNACNHLSVHAKKHE